MNEILKQLEPGKTGPKTELEAAGGPQLTRTTKKDGSGPLSRNDAAREAAHGANQNITDGGDSNVLTRKGAACEPGAGHQHTVLNDGGDIKHNAKKQRDGDDLLFSRTNAAREVNQ